MPDYTPRPGWDPNAPDILHIGTRVTFRYTPGRIGRVVEWRGPLGVGGRQIYRIRYGRKGARGYTEVPREHLIVLPPKEPKPTAGAADAPSATPPS